MVDLHIKMNEAEREALKHDAHQHDMNVSEYIKYLIEKERKECK